MDSQQYCLRWNNHLKNLTDVLTDFLREQVLCDVTLASNGQVFQAHQIVLSACSPYFETLFIQTPNKHPIVFLKDVSPNEVKALLDFMYKGEVNVSQNLLPSFLKTAESLQIRGLSDSNSLNSQADERETENKPPARREREVQKQGRDSPALKRKRTASNNNCDNSSNSVDRNTSDSQVFVSDSPVDRDRGRNERDAGGTPSIKSEPHDGNPVDTFHSVSEVLQSTPFLTPSISWGKHPAPPLASYQENECLSLTPLMPAPPHRHSMLRQYLDSPSVEESLNYDVISVRPTTSSGSELSSLQSVPSLYSRLPLPVPPELGGRSASQECSVIQSAIGQKSGGTSSTPSNTQSAMPKQLGRKGSKFRPSWLESYVWLQYDEQQNIMFCKFCRKWSGDMPDIRTSFAEGSTNFRLEIVNHHDKCKAHRLCVAREYHFEKAERSDSGLDGKSATSSNLTTSLYNLLPSTESRYKEEKPCEAEMSNESLRCNKQADTDIIMERKNVEATKEDFSYRQAGPGNI
uniref:BTB domain-containing protein n=1 Tax=Dendroctonus ponderosae TaxID=77166 RepID=A0AAR5PJH1_DENPD